jgi:hypothetical protein
MRRDLREMNPPDLTYTAYPAPQLGSSVVPVESQVNSHRLGGIGLVGKIREESHRIRSDRAHGRKVEIRGNTGENDPA